MLQTSVLITAAPCTVILVSIPARAYPLQYSLDEANKCQWQVALLCHFAC